MGRLENRRGSSVQDEYESESPESLARQEHARPRKRTRRACDKCSTSRTRCDGEYPCRRCEDYGYICRYNREVKKRGRLPGNGTRNADVDRQESPPIASPVGKLSSGTDKLPPILESVSRGHNGNKRPADAMGDGSQKSEPSGVPLSPRSFYGENGHSVRLPSSASAQSAPDFATLHHNSHHESRTRTRSWMDAPAIDNDTIIPDANGSGPSPGHSRPFEFQARAHRGSFRSNASNENRAAVPPIVDGPSPDLLQRAPTEDCRYRFLDPVLPYIRNIIPASVACELLDIFLTDPGSSLFRGASPYILTRVIRKRSILHPTAPRYATPALLATILWCVAQTADVMLLHVPGTRAKVVNDLYDLATALTSERDPDRWRRIHGGLRAENETPIPGWNEAAVPATTAANEPAGGVDDILTFILLSIAVSGGDFKSDSFKWWSKAVRLTLALRLNREDERCLAPVSPCANPLCSCHRDRSDVTLEDFERREERRRVFWLLYSLDRHLSLSFNTALSMPDSYCEVYSPLPDHLWEDLDTVSTAELRTRTIGPPLLATGTGFLEYFLPLMAILGDIIEVHHRRRHSRLGQQDDTYAVAVVQEQLANFEISLGALGQDTALNGAMNGMPTDPAGRDLLGGVHASDEGQSKIRLVKAYSTHILHVLHVLLHGKWDAISMLDDGDDWITSKRFTECASHAISASQSVSTILTIDPELTFMSYLFGIYLLQGSFILLLFADRMPQLGPNESVEQACENIIRAHEVCVVTLNTEFQKNFRKVVRSTLYSVRGAGTTNWEEHRARRRALSLYRWTKGAKGLAL